VVVGSSQRMGLEQTTCVQTAGVEGVIRGETATGRL
jgi:hypothetical protein